MPSHFRVGVEINRTPISGVLYKYKLGQIVTYTGVRPHSSRSMIGFSGAIIGYSRSSRDNSPMYHVFFEEYDYGMSSLADVPHTVFEDNLISNEPTWEL